MAVMELRGAGKAYPSGEVPVSALHPTHLAFEAGEFACVAGPSGSGKTTLLNLVGVLDLPSSGEVWVAGRCTADLTRSEAAAFRRDHVGFVFQSYNLVPVLTVWENVEYVLLLRGEGARPRRRRVEAVLDRVGLAGLGGKRPGEISGGEQQRAAVARAIVGDPAIVLADEPTSNLDSESATALLELMQGLNRERGTTFLFSSHDPRVIHRARRIVTLRDGRVTEDKRRDRVSTGEAV